jgi:Flp pilus assembly protein TadD/TolB-like protein
LSERGSDAVEPPALPALDTEAATVTVAPGPTTTRIRPFQPGTLVSGRFRIVREIAEGGMGVVYEAIDEKLVERRALKCAKPGFAGHLPPEARNSLRVTHPNVCRVFEIHTADTPLGAVDYLTMEYVDGGTLASALRQRGALPEPEARNIALQVCAGVAAAHEQHVLHRDLKPNNVLLTKDASGGTRAVVTDFGLAQDPTDAAPLPAWSGGAGTPAYLAPERWRGERATVASDVFALGVMLHELIAGRRPTIDHRGYQTAAPDLPPRWRTVIARCLESDPSKRYASVRAVADALIDRAGAIRRAAVWATATLAAILLIAWQVLFPSPIAARLAILPLAATDSNPRTVALAQGASADLSNRLIRRVPRPPQLVVIPVEETVGVSGEDPAVVRDRTGASHVLRGTLTGRGDQLIVRASIVDAATKLSIRDWEAQYPASDPGAIANALSGLVAAAFKLPRQRDAETVSPAAYSAYAEGIAALKQGAARAENAVAAFDRAIALDPRSVLPRAGLAEACYVAWVGSRDSRWLDRGRIALDEARRLNADALAVRLAAGRLNLVPGNYERAAEEYLRATELDNTSPEAWGGLARAYEQLPDRSGDAVSAYRKAIGLQPGYYALHVDLGAFYLARGNRPEAEKEWLTAVSLAPQARVVHANLGVLYVQAGRYADAERELLRALEIEPRLRAALNNLGALYQFLDRDADAIRFLEQARSLGNETPNLLSNLGDSYRRLGMTADAAVAYRGGRELAEAQLIRTPTDAALRVQAAYFALRLGESRASVRRELLQSLNADPQNPAVIRRAVLCYEAMNDRDAAIGVLASAPPAIVTDILRHPDLQELRSDPRLARLGLGGQ